MGAEVVQPDLRMVLLLNLATAHLAAITSLGGPVHGCAYLVVVILTLRRPGLGAGARLLGLLPGIGGLLVLRRIGSQGPPA